MDEENRVANEVASLHTRAVDTATVSAMAEQLQVELKRARHNTVQAIEELEQVVVSFDEVRFM